MKFFLGGAPTSVCHFFHLSIHPSIHPFVHPSLSIRLCPSVMHHISGTVHYLTIIFDTRVKWWYLQKKIYFFLILIFWAVWGLKEQKIAQNEKKQLDLSRAKSQEQYCIWSWFLVNVFKMMISPGAFFLFFEVFIFRAVRGVKEKKISQNEK